MQKSRLTEYLDRLPPDALAYVNALTGNGGDVMFKEEFYYSRIRLEGGIAVDGSNNLTLTFAQGLKAQAFGYGQGGPLASAGFVASGTGFTVATPADTNLTSSNGKETNGSDMQVIDGIAIMPTPRCDPALLRDVLPETFITCGFGGIEDVKLGSPLFYPAGLGLSGGGNSVLDAPALSDVRAAVGNVSNGHPSIEAVQDLKDPLVWYPKPQPDSQFTLSLTVARPVVVTSAARAAATGVAAFTPPATAGARGTFLDLWVLFRGTQIGPRGRAR